ncbi:glycosyltransferase [Cellulosilyticum ruminicola]|uniref:glycosyltransferase n=1 Tax=Cellulosilyticum ruminicola TaxID=425254 RepID=UPI0006D148F9|nr:glycosyltransferase [Cellulosilyticum ruminicola]
MEFTGERFIPDEELDMEITVEHLQRYEAICKLASEKVVLDAASGEGYGSALIAQYAKEVYGLDISREAVENANKKYIKDNLNYIEGSVTNIPLEDNSVDMVVSFETIEHIDETAQLQFMKEIKRVLKEDGMLVISTPNKKVYSEEFNFANKFHVREFYKDEFINMIQSEFNNYEMYCQFKEVAYYLTKDDENTCLKKGNYSEDFAKYYVCIASNQAIKHDILSNITIQNETEYIKKMHRILDLQNEVESRNNHIQKLDTQIEEKDERIVQLQDEVEERNIGLVRLNDEVEKYQGQVNNLNEVNRVIEMKLEEKIQELEIKDRELEIKDRELEIKDRELEIKDKELEIKIKQLEESNNKLEEYTKQNLNLSDELALIKFELEQKIHELDVIYHSTGWKMLIALYKVRDSIFPKDTKRRLFVKIVKKVVTRPGFYIKHLNKDNLKKFFKYMKSEDPEMIADRFDKYEVKQDSVPIEKIEIIKSEVCTDEIVFNYEENPTVTIIIPVYNQYEYTYNCLKSIKENTQDVTYEIIIADDVSSDETANIKEYVKNITVIRNEKNLGFLLNCNNAAQKARGKYVHFLNNDTQVQPGWLSSLVELIESDEKIGMVGSKLVYPTGQLQEAGGILWEDGSAWNYGRNDDPEKSEYNYVKEADYISGASILLSKKLWDEIGGFDERYIPAYCEDSDLAFEVRKHGYKVMYQPKSVIVHFEGVSNGTDTNVGLKAYQVTNQKKFYEKWGQVLKEEHFPNGQNVFVARDKKCNQKTVLVIDHYVPHYDKDAGSKTVYQYLKMFVSQGFNVKLLVITSLDMNHIQQHYNN